IPRRARERPDRRRRPAGRDSCRARRKRRPQVAADEDHRSDHSVRVRDTSTLMKIMYGIGAPDAGTIRWEGAPAHIANPAQARKLGIGMVFQHFSLFDTLTVADNIRLAVDEQDAAQLPAKIRDVSARYGLTLDPTRRV